MLIFQMSNLLQYLRELVCVFSLVVMKHGGSSPYGRKNIILVHGFRYFCMWTFSFLSFDLCWTASQGYFL